MQNDFTVYLCSILLTFVVFITFVLFILTFYYKNVDINVLKVVV